MLSFILSISLFKVNILFFETINVVNEHVWIDFFPKKKYGSTLICMKNLRIKA